MDFSTRLRGINPTNTVFYSPEPRAEVYCLQMNFKISKLAYCCKTLISKYYFINLMPNTKIKLYDFCTLLLVLLKQ